MLWLGRTKRMSKLLSAIYRTNRLTRRCCRCHRQILEAREKITNAIEPLQPERGVRRRAEDVTVALRDIESKISGELEGVLLASLRVSQQRIAQITATEPLRMLLEQGLATRKSTLTEKLDSIRWDVSSPSTLRAVAGDGPIENVSPPVFRLIAQTDQVFSSMSCFFPIS